MSDTTNNDALRMAEVMRERLGDCCAADLLESMHYRIVELEAESARLRARKPMTDYQLRKIIEWLNKEYLDDAEGWGYGDFAKAIEAAHEIGGVNAD